MKVPALILAIALLAGCASKSDYYVSPTPVHIPETATYWIDSFDLALVGENPRFLSQDILRQRLRNQLSDKLSTIGRYAKNRESADYLLHVSTVYTRHISDSKGGLVSMIVDDNTILASVDFSYKVKVSRSGAEVLNFAQARDRLMPAGVQGNLRNYKTMWGAISNKGNSDVEEFYVDVLPNFIVKDIEGIPSR
ncbi:hypothetical protein [Pseudomonas asplenii]|uniref:hypothetical protein n=1 Tax=Pseudomonas asplenii TaxID=53407 RepID=UPI0006B5E46F|nr:hypothetical protein [Pseudomonas fuscovaginae]KPA94570.1 hypothetical protein PF70_05446 [Pseudomonas fuscovaginae]